MKYTQQDINHIVFEARHEAAHAATKYFHETLGGRDQYACGFSWVSIHGVKGSTKLGRMLKIAGVRQSYDRTFQLWNPSGLAVQNIDCLEEGSRAAAKVFEKYGFQAYAGSRLD